MVCNCRLAASRTQASALLTDSSRGRPASRLREKTGEKPASSIWRRISVLTGSLRALSPHEAPAKCCSTMRRSERISSITSAETISACVPGFSAGLGDARSGCSA